MAFLQTKNFLLLWPSLSSSSGGLPASRVSQFLEQITAIATLMASVLKDSELTRLAKRCGMLGFMFYAYDRTGKIAASSMQSA